LFKSISQLKLYIQKNVDKRVWILGPTEGDYVKDVYPLEVVHFLESIEGSKVYTARDGYTPVYLIRPGSEF